MIQVIRERRGPSINGWLVLPVLLAGFPLSFAGFSAGAQVLGPGVALVSMLAFFACFIALRGLFVVQPNEARVLQLFGAYRGSVRQAGLRFTNPFYSKKRVSVRVNNFESQRLKVNDADGNPVEIAAVVVWRISDSAEAMFHVNDVTNFVSVQSEAALRNLATQFPYDQHVDGEVALRSHAGHIADQLREEIQARLAAAGVEVIESRISHLAYAPEIASAMLQRQQASAIVSARQKIVEGAVGMVETALDELSSRRIVELDAESKGELVSNLLVVLCSDNAAQPVVQTGR